MKDNMKDNKLLNMKQAAHLLGLSYDTVRDAVKDGSIPSVTIKKRAYIKSVTIDGLLEA